MKSMLEQVVRWTGAVCVAIASASCGGGGGGGGGGTAPTTTISGIVSDDIIVGATVTATALDTGLVLGTAVTGVTGNYSLAPPTSSIGSGYALQSTGGTMNGLPFGASLSAIYSASANAQQSNLTLITSALAQAANSTTQFPGNLLQRHQAITASAISLGVIGPDYFLVNPSGNQMAGLQSQAASMGVLPTIAGLQSLVADPAQSNGCGALDTTCTKVVGNLEALSINLQGATVNADALALNNCIVSATFDPVGQTMSVTLKNIPSTTAGSTAPITCQATKKVTLTLPDISSQAPDACLTPTNRARGMSNCVTIGSQIQPSYFVMDGYYSHRTDSPIHQSNPKVGQTVTLTRSYGAVLNSSRAPFASGSAASQWGGKIPVIFVHGYSMGSAFGGDDGTWGALPDLVLEDASYVALNFQWRSDASYLTVAKELATAVDYAYLSTGNKVHIVAHSFGGVLSRVMLQNLTGTTNVSAAKVASLTTVGTPHSGIVKGTPIDVDVGNGFVTLPGGWGSWAPDKFCGQISCYQSGLNAKVADWAIASLTEVPLAAPTGPGYINARLARTRGNLPADLKILVLIGQIVKQPNLGSNLGATFSTDDGLITYLGQRFDPSTTALDLLSNVSFGGASVTERILGMTDPTAKAAPNTSVDLALLSAYAKKPTRSSSVACNKENKIGYRHSSPGAMMLNGATDGCVQNSEVYIPDGSDGAVACGTRTTCKHDTWLNLQEFIKPGVTGIAPATATASTATTFTVTGQNLPLTAAMSLAGGSCQTPTNQSAGGFTVVCTPSAVVGSQVVTISTPVSGGTVIDASRSIAVSAAPVTPPPSTGTGLLTDTGITANQCYQAGSDVLVSCTSAGAIALNDKQDGMIGRDVTTPDATDGKLGFSYTKLDSNGSPLPAGATSWSCTLDNFTGLIWQMKTNDGSVLDKTRLFTNIGDGRPNDVSSFAAAVNANNLCGYTDWRVSTIDELLSIQNFGINAIDPDYFESSYTVYWTGTPYVGNSTNAWIFGTYANNYGAALRVGTSVSIRAVRGGISSLPSSNINRYSFSLDGSMVTDTVTGLIWKRCTEGQVWDGSTCAGTASNFTLDQAFAIAGGQNGWRVPNIKELSTIVDLTRSSPSINISAFPNVNTQYGYLSTTPLIYNPTWFWHIEFTNGGNGHLPKTNSGYLRLVK